MFPALMAVSLALFGISIFALVGRTGALEAPAAPGDQPEPQNQGVSTQVESVINERVAQLDEKLVDLHTRTAAQLKADLDDAEGRLKELEKDVAAKLEAAAEGTGGAVPSTADIPDLKHVMQERMEQFDAKIIDMHNHIAKRIQETADETEEKIRALGEGGGGGVDAEQLKKVILGELEKFDKRITALQAGGGDAGEELAARISQLEGKLDALPAEGDSETGGEAVVERLAKLEEQVAAVAAGGPPTEDGGPPPDVKVPDVEQIMQERMQQFDEKVIDMHTRVAQRLEQVAEETEEKIRAQGEAPPGDAGGSGGSDPEVIKKIRELEEKIKNLPSGTSAPGSAPPDWEGTGVDPEQIMKERMEQFDAKLIDMHTRAAKRLGDVAEEMEQKIMAMGEEGGKSFSDRLSELEAQVRTILDMVNKDE